MTRAREALGDKAPTLPTFRGRRDDDRGPGVLGKRRRGSQDASSSEEEVPEDVQRIPMPRDTPPPIPKEVLDRWYSKRRARRAAENAARQERDGPEGSEGREKAGKTEMPAMEPKTVYEAKPVMRDLRREAVSAFVPAAVQAKMTKGRGQGGLMEPEEADQLEREGYLKSTPADGGPSAAPTARTVTVEEVDDEEDR